MKKLAVVLLTLSVLVLFAPSVSAQKQTERWVCLDVAQCNKETSGCSAAHKGNGHTAKLSAKTGFAPLVGQPTYVVVCIATENGQICTTGNAAADQTVYGKSNITEMQTSLNYTFHGLFMADGTTNVQNPAEWKGPYEWFDELHPGKSHSWLAMNYWDPQKAATGGEGGQQQGTFDFENAEKDCLKIAWDPYGRVFDAGTLEPITGATVTLQVKKDGTFKTMTTADLVGGNLINPQTTLIDGNFSFVVPDGEYKLLTVPTALADTTTLDPNYTKAYSDIYPAVTGESIIQQGAIQHRDIPVATKGTNTTPKLMEYMYETTSAGLIVIQGRVSHPLTKLNVKTSKVMATDPTTKVPYRTVGTFSADKMGAFRIEVDQNKFEKTADYMEVFSDVELVKVDLRQPTTRSVWQNIVGWMKGLVRPVEAATTTSIKFEPIPQYLEGYAYDANGKVLPNATVGVYLTFSNKPYSQVTTDEKGFFKLTSEYLPRFPYELRYTSAAGATVKVKPSVFIAQNQKYITEQKINPYIARDLKNQIAPTNNPTVTRPAGGGTASTGRNTSVGAGGMTTGGGTGGTGETATSQKPAVSYGVYVLILVVVMLVLIGVGVWLVLHFKKAHGGDSLPPPQGVM